jgi:hypothetical protein
MSATDDCPCLACGPKPPDRSHVRDIGVDPCGGRYADVDLIRCERCGRLWLRYQWEIESETASGCWYETVISETEAPKMTAEAASEFILRAPWRIRGGSFFGHDGERIDRPAMAAPKDDAVTFMKVSAKYSFVIRLCAGEQPAFFNRRTLRWHPWPRPIPPCARSVSRAVAWTSIYQDTRHLDFGTLDRPWREWPEPMPVIR